MHMHISTYLHMIELLGGDDVVNDLFTLDFFNAKRVMRDQLREIMHESA